MKRIWVLFSLFLLFAFTNSVLAFSDVSVSHENFEAVNFVKEAGIVKGYEDGTFRPDQKINRAEFIKIVIRSKYGSGALMNCENYHYFTDVDNDNDWFYRYVCFAKEKGLVDGYPDGTFRASNNISFVEAAKIISNAFKFSVEDDVIWYRPFVKKLEDKLVIPTSIKTFGYEITRGEMAEMIWRLKNEIKGKPYKTYEDLEIGGLNREVCLMDIKICPDGSGVSRDHDNNCEFAECPDSQTKKEEALNFSLKIVESYFHNDCETFYDSLERELFILEDNIIVNLKEMDGTAEKLCKSISKAVEGDFDYKDYLDSYDFKILEKSEYDLGKIGFEQQKNINFSGFSSNDYLFVGYELKNGKEGFVWDDLLFFMVREKNNNWTISAISG